MRRLCTILGRVIRDITRKIAFRPDLTEAFALPLSLARRVRDQRQRERGRKIYSLHAPEVECIGKGKAHRQGQGAPALRVRGEGVGRDTPSPLPGRAIRGSREGAAGQPL